MQSNRSELRGAILSCCVDHREKERASLLNRRSAVFQGDLVACGVLSGNRQFEGRLCNCVRANYLASPPLVVAYALAGTVGIDFEKEPLGKGGRRGEPSETSRSLQDFRTWADYSG